MTRFLYTLLLCALVPRALLHLLLRSRRQRGYLDHIPERFGFYGLKPAGKLIWVHAVSVGETRAAQPLIRALQAAHPDHRILLTHMTPTGRETGVTLFGDSVERCYLPYDLPWAVARFLDRFRPMAGVVLETEVWPNLIRACHARRIPLYLVNARLSERSFRRYRRFSALTAESLRELAGISAQSGDDAARLAVLGATGVNVTGNLKFDIEPDPTQLALGAEWRKAYGASRQVLLAASTREGEEALLLEALQAANVPGLLLVIVPRHPQRFAEVASLIESAGIAFRRRSANQPIAAGTRVLLGDSMGEMFAYLAACDVALIGGSLRPFGAQNPIEACAAGRPFIVGPSIYNFTEATQLALAAGAAIQVADAREMLAQAVALVGDKARASRMGEAALAFARSHRGATAKVIGLIKFAGA
jgi:3-deoxy-D-manno-octulosonic-acid transferase